jgi:hypothetical protein
MCCSIRREGVVKQVRNYPKLNITYKSIQGSAHFSGFAKIEKLNWWKTHGNSVGVNILADTFTEGKVEFRVPQGRLAGIGLRRDIKVSGKTIGQTKTVRLLTREARSEVERSIHSRWPVVTVNGELYTFTEKDIVSRELKQQELGF